MKVELTDIRLLSLLSVLPLMLLGVWMISNESFANVGSRSAKYSRVVRVESQMQRGELRQRSLKENFPR